MQLKYDSYLDLEKLGTKPGNTGTKPRTITLPPQTQGGGKLKEARNSLFYISSIFILLPLLSVCLSIANGMF